MDESELHTIRSSLALDPLSVELNAKVYEAFPLPAEARQLIDFYRQLQRLYPDDWRHLVNLGRAYSATGKDSLAIVQLQKLLRADSTLLDVWMDLAYCYHRLKKPELALRTINSAIDINPSFETAHIARVVLLVEANEQQEAAAAVVLSLSCDRLSPNLILWLEEIDEFLESNLTPPAELLLAMGPHATLPT